MQNVLFLRAVFNITTRAMNTLSMKILHKQFENFRSNIYTWNTLKNLKRLLMIKFHQESLAFYFYKHFLLLKTTRKNKNNTETSLPIKLFRKHKSLTSERNKNLMLLLRFSLFLKLNLDYINIITSLDEEKKGW